MAVSQHSKLHRLFPFCLTKSVAASRLGLTESRINVNQPGGIIQIDIKEDDTIYIDTGTTCLNLVDFIADKHCTILTNSLLIFNKAASYPNLDIISVPGKLNRKTLSFTGPDINDYLQTYNISMAFMACTGVTMKSGLTNASAEEYITKKAIAENANSMILLADHSKFGRISLMTYSSMEKLDAIVTDQSLPEEYDSFCQEHGIRVMTID